MPAAIKLGGREYALKFGPLSHIRVGSVENPPGLDDLSKPRRARYALCVWLWACMERNDRFRTHEDIAEFLDTNEQIEDAMRALLECMKESLPSAEKKTS
jgi:hypothetical protein